MKLTKVLHGLSNGAFSQEIDITVEFEDDSIEEVCEVVVTNQIGGKAVSSTDIRCFLETQNLLDALIDSIDWHELYADTKAELKN